MIQRPRSMPSLADMAEATRLTRAGRLEEAQAVLRRGVVLQPVPSSEHPRDTSASPRTIDLVATRHEDAPDHGKGEPAPAAAPHGLREVLGQALRGLGRDIAPALKGFGGMLQDGPESGPDANDPRFAEHSFSGSNGARSYKLYVPERAVGPRPLVVMLHGCTQSPDDFAAGTRMNALAEAEGFYVLYPHQTRAANAQKCWNWFQAGDQGREMGETGLIAGMTRAVMKEHPIDPSQVYIAGLSAGGAAAANIARAYPDLYAAVGVHSGLAAGCARDLPSALMAMRSGAAGGMAPGGASGFGGGPEADALRVPLIVFHGKEDATVHPRNGEALVAQAGLEGLRATRKTGERNGRRYVRTRYADAAGTVHVEAWFVDGGGHAWVGGSQAGSYADPQGPDATRALIDFFREHRLGSGRA